MTIKKGVKLKEEKKSQIKPLSYNKNIIIHEPQLNFSF